MKPIHTALGAMALLAAFTAPAFAAGDHAQHGAQAAAGAGEMAMTAGVVKKVDTEQGKVTIQHEAITNLDMPPMTMVFRADKQVLNGVKAGDKIQFHAESTNGGISVTHIQAQK
jgi:Cu(I)/Ag(I) efflux system protein CusF